MDLNLKHKVAFVSGSSSGIGKAIATLLHKEGCIVVLNGKNTHSLKLSAKSIGKNVDYFVGDVTKLLVCKSAIKYVIKKHGKLDILICNVGSGHSVSRGKATINEWKKMFDINFFSTTNLVETSRNELSQTKGSITCISSIAGIDVLEAPVSYSVAKSALNMYVRGISRLLSKQNIRINAVAPGNILFKDSVWDKKLKKNFNEVKDMLNKEVTMNRLGTLDEIANFVVFIASPISSFTTGSIFVVDGGQVR